MKSAADLYFQSPIEFASFGTGALAYVRKVNSDDLNLQISDEDELPQGAELWGLFSADGAPIAVSDEESELILNAKEMDLVPVHLH